MADKAISELIAADQITSTDMFVLEQNGTAKRLTGQVLLNWLTRAADGHGGISEISKVSTTGLADTYRITLADTTIFDFVVTNGRGVSSIEKTSTDGLVDTYSITYNDGTSSTLTVTNGERGPKGDNVYLWIKYASQEPTENSHSIGDLPDDWIGIYSGSLSSAPEDWRQYSWFEIKGRQGETGAPAVLVSTEVTYQMGDSGTIIPSGNWVTTIPVVAQGKYLWTRTTQTFNTGSPAVSYSVARMGLDGAGSVVSVNDVSPDAEGNVELTHEDVNAAPAGYGLGRLVNYECSNDAEVDAKIVSLIASMGDHEFRRVVLSFTSILESLKSGGHWYADIYKLSTNYAIVTAKTYYLRGCTIQRIWYEGELKPWEWFNPPMITGVEYRTTKRYNGSAVYVKKVDFGALPNKTEKGVYAVPANARTIGIGGNARGQYDIAIPGYYAVDSFGVSPETGVLWLSTTEDMSAYSADITVWYIKE